MIQQNQAMKEMITHSFIRMWVVDTVIYARAIFVTFRALVWKQV